MKIGFIDFYLCEFHAENYPAWFAEIAQKTGQDIRVVSAWAEEEVSPVDGRTSQDWSALTGVPVRRTLQEVCNESDCLLILSPDNAENHLRYAEAVLPYGKPVYIDKTFSPDFKTGEQIFSLAEKYGVPLCSTSALRCAEEIASVQGDARSIVTFGGGGSFERYAVHQLEMIVKAMGVGANRVMALSSGASKSFAIDYGGGRSASLHYVPGAPFCVGIEGADGVPHYYEIVSDYFRRLMEEIVVFFQSGKVCAPKEQTLEIMRLRDACVEAEGAPWQFFEIR